MGKDITKQEREFITMIALGNRSILTLILDHCESSVCKVPGAHAMLAEVAKLRVKVAALEPITDSVKKNEAPYWDLERWW